MKKLDTGLFGVLLFPFIFCSAYISYCLLCSLRTQTFPLCPSFFICMQTVRLMCTDEAWVASSVYLPASMPGSSQKIDIFMGFLLSLHGSVPGYAPRAQKWINVPQWQNLCDDMFTQSLVKWERGVCFAHAKQQKDLIIRPWICNGIKLGFGHRYGGRNKKLKLFSIRNIATDKNSFSSSRK